MTEEKKENQYVLKSNSKGKFKSLLKAFNDNKHVQGAARLSSLITGLRIDKPDAVMKNGEKRAL